MNTAARERWRADVEDYHAQLLRSVHLDNDAAPKEANAQLRRAFADLQDEYDAAHAAYLADLERATREWGAAQAENGVRRALADFVDGDVLARRKAVGAELAEMRRVWRQTGEDLGVRPPVGVVNHFAEPSDEELI